MFPNLIEHGSRRFFFRSGIERYKAKLAGIPFRDDPDAGPDVMVPIKIFALEMGVTVRTIERRIAESRNAAIAAEYETAPAI
jgi:hypothetical protein